jgi:chromate transporter
MTVQEGEGADSQAAPRDSVWAVFLIFLRLGLTSFGGPVAHLGYFREEFVNRRRWLSERSYADLIALCQFLPGPASSQIGMALGLSRRGYRGALAAWVGFTLPSAVALILFAQALASPGADIPAGMLHGLKIVAVAVVAQAVWGMARQLCTDLPHIAIMAAAACAALLLAGAFAQVAIITLAGILGLVLFKPEPGHAHDALPVGVGSRAGFFWLSLLLVLLIGLPLLAALLPSTALQVFDAFFRTGALVFGGGHVVLPLLQAEVVQPGWVDNDTFLAGYGAAQAVPGPLFTFAAFLGASLNGAPSGWAGGMLCLVAVFAPSFFLVAGALPFWERLRSRPGAQAALMGINAAVVGLLLAALYQPVWTSAIKGPLDFAIALIAFIALMFWRLPPWLVVTACGLVGWLVTLAA